jgi:hypothetical protein
MRSITLELAPFFMIDVFYTVDRNMLYTIISASIQGYRLHLSDEQKDYLEDEIHYINVKELDNNNDEDLFYYNENN